MSRVEHMQFYGMRRVPRIRGSCTPHGGDESCNRVHIYYIQVFNVDIFKEVYKNVFSCMYRFYVLLYV